MIINNNCLICGGDFGTFNSQGEHYLCAALKAVGRPTPCLGHRCLKCNGSGVVAKSNSTALLSLELSPATIKNAVMAVFPPCPDCNGKGHTV